MADYKAPRDDMDFVLHDVLNVAEDWQQAEQLADMMDIDTASAILDEAAKVSENLIAPQARQADEAGVSFNNGVVTTPPNYKENFRKLAEGGWVGVTANPDFGGMGLPKSLSAQYEEMLSSADIAFSLYPGLTSGAIMAIDLHGTEAMKNLYLPKMAAGEWTGTMCLTEPHAGTDLGIIKSKAVSNGDGSYAVTGTKIFITGGEHDLADNIVHLVLAKLPDAPPGTKGISMFLVPKIVPDENAGLGQPNALSCGSVEHKMGIHGSATCVMNFDGATGWLVGEPHRGLAAMFTMMNYERLGVGIQGLGAAERSYQTALTYAKERIQGRGAKASQQQNAEADSILVHGDVRRMLLTMKALTEGGRAFSSWVGQQLDRAKYTDDKQQRQRADAMVALLTPVAKAFLTDTGLESTVHGQQVLGGHGYVREWGQEQLVRDVRIAQIYEGTNGIQALDLLGRKVVGSGGDLLQPFSDEIESFIESLSGNKSWRKELTQLKDAVKSLNGVSKELVEKAAADENLVSSVAVEYLHLIGYIAFGYLWLRMAVVAQEKQAQKPYLAAKVKTAKFYFSRVLPRTHSLLAVIKDGSESLYLHDPEQF
ncbi:acyl-CoA dehydrogenase C-terminal domain-containing protein [Idiomarina seosinensis]|uniref:acyl-CoA dehydrogenase C-terminal domain-containing protein n=1 Tax=Idiomarina seosinensis TaxID=281739 RepID=UPI00384D7E93